MVAKKREKKTGNPARSRFVIGRGGGPFGRYISVLEWCSVAPTVVYFVSFGQHLGTICTFISQSTESVEIEIENLNFSSFLSRFILFAFRLWIFLLDTVYIAPIDRPCLAISLLLRFPFCGFLLNLPLHSSFHYCFLSFFFFFFFRFAIESFLRSFLIFFPIRSSLPLSITRKKKNTMERDFIRRYLKKAIFR